MEGMLMLPAEFTGRFSPYLQLQRLLTVIHTISCNKNTVHGSLLAKIDNLKPLEDEIEKKTFAFPSLNSDV